MWNETNFWAWFVVILLDYYSLDYCFCILIFLFLKTSRPPLADYGTSFERFTFQKKQQKKQTNKLTKEISKI